MFFVVSFCLDTLLLMLHQHQQTSPFFALQASGTFCSGHKDLALADVKRRKLSPEESGNPGRSKTYKKVT